MVRSVSASAMTSPYVFNWNDYPITVPSFYGASGENPMAPRPRQSFSLGTALWRVFKGGVVDTVKGLFSKTGLLMTGALVAIGFSPLAPLLAVALPYLIGAGFVIGGAKTAISGYQAVKRGAQGDIEGCYDALEGVGSGLATVGLSAWGARSLYRAGAPIQAGGVNYRVAGTAAESSTGNISFREAAELTFRDIFGLVRRLPVDPTAAGARSSIRLGEAFKLNSAEAYQRISGYFAGATPASVSTGTIALPANHPVLVPANPAQTITIGPGTSPLGSNTQIVSPGMLPGGSITISSPVSTGLPVTVSADTAGLHLAMPAINSNPVGAGLYQAYRVGRPMFNVRQGGNLSEGYQWVSQYGEKVGPLLGFEWTIHNIMQEF